MPMKTHSIIVLLLCLLQMILAEGGNTARELTFYVFARQVECLFESVKTGEELSIDYQVIDGGHGDLDITLSLYDGRGTKIFHDYKKSEGTYRHLVQEAGDYSVCFDNTFSAFNRKTVFLELYVESQEPEGETTEAFGITAKFNTQQLYEMQLFEIMAYINRIHSTLSKARQIQDMLRSTEARDRNLAEANFLKVNNWSLFQVCAMILVGLLQVFLVRSIFDTNTRMSKLWQKVGY